MREPCLASGSGSSKPATAVSAKGQQLPGSGQHHKQVLSCELAPDDTVHHLLLLLQVFFNGGILSNDASTPVNGSAFEVLDLRTLSPYVVQVCWINGCIDMSLALIPVGMQQLPPAI
jgi:hypothetical protein